MEKKNKQRKYKNKITKRKKENKNHCHGKRRASILDFKRLRRQKPNVICSS